MENANQPQNKGKKVTGFEVEFNYNEEDSFGGWTKK